MTGALHVRTGGPAAHRMLPLTWALLAAVSLAACTSSEPSPPRQAAPTAAASPKPSPEAPAETPTPAALSTAAATFSALWPETAAADVPTSPPAWRRSAEQTAHRFATSVLGWGDPQVTSAESQAAVESGTEVFLLSRAAGAPRIEVHLERMVDAEHWSVTYLWGFGKDDHPASVSVTPEKAHVGFGYWGDAASAQLLLRYGRHQIERTSDETAEWDVPTGFPLDTTGAVMVLFRDAQGHVFTGWGTALPAGDFAAG